MTVVKRVMVVGGSGAGKTWLALQLARRFGLPVHHVDQLSWQPGFIHRTAEELDGLTRDIHARDAWVLEGGHYETARERASRAQLLIWVDPGRTTQMARVAWRSLRHHGKVRPGMGEGCCEWFGTRTIEAMTYASTSRDFHRDRAQEVTAAAPASLGVLHLRSALHTYRFLWHCRALGAGPGFAIDHLPLHPPLWRRGAALMTMLIPALSLVCGAEVGIHPRTGL
ncbi:hypothetical protein PANO111632_09545 [Paracoccus nototheniae]|uniref:DNA topology modulation protein FlaR n=1 Tax=Paracoccus nototheniae TaxID=2489002 RepID=A0ABW4E029_9RHOB|nr:hypothetical protein [Paracoccus nototheniae]